MSAEGTDRGGTARRSGGALAPALAVALTGVGAGVGAALLVLLLHLVQHAAYGYSTGSFADAVERADPTRRVVAMAVGGLLVGLAWAALRRWTSPLVDVRDAVEDPRRHRSVAAVAADAAVQVAAVGVGASLGREGAPRQVGAALAGAAARRLGLGAARQRTLVACGAGAGLAAVYDVPLSGALFTLEVLLCSAAAADVVPAVATAAIAAVVAWPVVGRDPVYPLGPGSPPGVALVVFAVLVGPLAGVVGLAFTRLTTWARTTRPAGWWLPLATTGVFTAVGALATVRPEVLGNGRGPADLAFTGAAPAGIAAILLVAKPVATAATLRSGAAGGLLTPALATGAVLGALTGALAALAAPTLPLGACAVVAAAAVLATTQRAPLLALALLAELTGSLALLVPTSLAVAGAAATAHGWERRRAGRRGRTDPRRTVA